jgi:hypothetical protein
MSSTGDQSKKNRVVMKDAKEGTSTGASTPRGGVPLVSPRGSSSRGTSREGKKKETKKVKRGTSANLKPSFSDVGDSSEPKTKKVVVIPKPPEGTERKPTNLKFEDLPDKIQLKCMESDVPLQQYKDDIATLYACAKFIHGAEFGISKVENRTQGKPTAYATDDFLEFGSTLTLLS